MSHVNVIRMVVVESWRFCNVAYASVRCYHVNGLVWDETVELGRSVGTYAENIL